MKSSLKWKPATTIYPTDHIISSKARELGTWGFKPQYENVKHVNIRFILSNEYMRLWFKERELYQKENYAKHEKAQNESHLKRGFVQRMMVHPKSNARELPIIELKRFQNIISKIDNRRSDEEKIRICERYKKTLQVPAQNIRYKPACPSSRPKNANGSPLKKDMNIRNEAGKKIEADKKVKAGTDDDKKTPQEDTSSTELRADCPLVCKVIK